MSGDGGGSRTPLVNSMAGEEVRNEMVKNGFGEWIRRAEAFHEIDTAEMKRIAREVYGTSHDLNMHQAALVDPRVDDPALGNASAPISDLAVSAYRRMQGDLEKYWEGPAFEAFDVYYKKLRAVTDLEAMRLGFIGDEVSAMADNIEQEQLESEDAFLGALNMILLAGGLSAPSVVGIILTAASAIHLAVTNAEQQVDERSRKIEGLHDATVDLSGPAILGVDPSKLMPEFPDMDDWRVEER